MGRMQQPPESDVGENLRLLERALDYLSQDNINFARLVLNRRMQQFGKDAEGLCHLAMTYARENRFAEAIDLYEQALDLCEDEMDVLPEGEDYWEDCDGRRVLRCLHGLGLSQMENAEHGAAEETFRHMLKLSPADPLGVQQMLGIIRHWRGCLDEAIQHYRQFQHDPMMTYNLAIALFQRGDLDQAVLVLRQALLANPYVPSAMLADVPEPFAYPYLRGTEEPEYAWAYAGTCGDFWENTPGGFAFLRAVVQAEIVQSEGSSYRELADAFTRERRKLQKERLEQELKLLASAKRMRRGQPAVLQAVRQTLQAEGVPVSA